MKKILLSAVVILILHPVFAQSPAWLWADGTGMAAGSASSIATDANDNVYITGTFSGTPFIFGNDTLMYTGTDVFIAKYDASGNEIWARSAQGAGNENVSSICTDINGNVYITGTFTSPITFGSTTLTSSGVYDIFIAKYDPAGNVLWSYSAGGSNFEYSGKIASDNNGNVYMTGRFSSASITFGSITLLNTGSGGQDVFFVKYDSAGNVLWARSDTGDDYRGIGFDLAGNVFLTGTYADASITYGSAVLNNADVTGSTVDLFVAKHDSAGNIIRAWDAGGTGDDGTAGISVTGDGHVYIAGGFFSNTIAFGSTTLVNGSSYDDIFIAKYDSVGNALWARRAGGTYNQWPRAIGIDAGGNAYMTGYFQSATCTFGSTVLINAGSFNEDIFIAKYDASGNLMWALGVGSTAADNSNAIAVNAVGNVCITGSFGSSSLSFGSINLINTGGTHIFTAKLDYATSITEQNYNGGIKIFPNPAANEFTIYDLRFTISDVEVYNAFGKKIFSQQPAANSQELGINVSEFAPGIYFVKVKSEGLERIAKFVKQ